MGEHRVICAGPISDALIHTIADALRDRHVTSITIHKATAVFDGDDGRRYVVGSDGEPRLVGVHSAEGVTSC